MRGIALGLSLALLVGCSHLVPPSTRVFAPLRPESDPVVYATANSNRDLVENALREAGVNVASDLLGATLILRAKVGSARAWGQCGIVRNVLFDLRQQGERIAVIKARGWIGPSPRPRVCERFDILRDMSEELARLLSGAPG